MIPRGIRLVSNANFSPPGLELVQLSSHSVISSNCSSALSASCFYRSSTSGFRQRREERRTSCAEQQASKALSYHSARGLSSLGLEGPATGSSFSMSSYKYERMFLPCTVNGIGDKYLDLVDMV